MAKKREKLFTLTAKDFAWNYFNGTGNGGSNRNKTSNCVRCIHPPSGAMGVSQEERSQVQNKQKAFKRCTETKEFKAWHKLECARRSGQLEIAKQKADEQMIGAQIEVQDESGKWVKAGKITKEHLKELDSEIENEGS